MCVTDTFFRTEKCVRNTNSDKKYLTLGYPWIFVYERLFTFLRKPKKHPPTTVKYFFTKCVSGTQISGKNSELFFGPRRPSKSWLTKTTVSTIQHAKSTVGEYTKNSMISSFDSQTPSEQMKSTGLPFSSSFKLQRRVQTGQARRHARRHTRRHAQRQGSREAGREPRSRGSSQARSSAVNRDFKHILNMCVIFLLFFWGGTS